MGGCGSVWYEIETGLGRLKKLRDERLVAVIGRIDIGHEAGRAAGRLRGGFAALLRTGRRSPARRSVGVAVVEICLVIGLGLAFGRVAMTLVSPLPVAENPPPPVRASSTETTAGNPFRAVAAPDLPAAGVDMTEAAETTLDLSLHGTWVDADTGSAVIQLPGGEQETFFVGDTICCGARLDRVFPDRVIISRGGVRETLRLADKKAAPAARRAPQVEPRAGAGGPLARFREIARFQPARAADGSFRLQIYPGDDEAAFERLGLRSGDILYSINDEPAPSNIGQLGEMLASLDGAGPVLIGVERAGARISLEVQAGGGEQQAVTQ